MITIQYNNKCVLSIAKEWLDHVNGVEFMGYGMDFELGFAVVSLLVGHMVQPPTWTYMMAYISMYRLKTTIFCCHAMN